MRNRPKNDNEFKFWETHQEMEMVMVDDSRAWKGKLEESSKL